MKIFLSLILVFCLAFTSPGSMEVNQKVEIAFCLDLSNSTNGLLSDIRDNLWQFVNNARKNLPESDLCIGVIVFARPGFGKKNNYVKVLSDFSENYDFISYRLFQLSANTENGDHYDGSALNAALKNLHWSNDTETKKMIYLIGNGNIKKGGYDYRKACNVAAERNIPIHAVYCIKQAVKKKELPAWNSIAETTGGNFNTYQLTKRSPQKASGDLQWLVDLNEKLHDTYIYYTKDGKSRYDWMVAADANSKRMGEQFFYMRCYYRLSSHYEEQCRQWDLVSLMKTSPPDFDKLNRKYLPIVFQKISAEDLKALAETKIARRDSLMSQMQNAFLDFKTDDRFMNPIDSIFSSGLSRF